MCKNTIIEILRKIFGKVFVDYNMNVTANLEEYKNSEYYSVLNSILIALENTRGYKNFIKLKNMHRFDLFIPNPGFAVELDESQHFTNSRKLSLSLYPETLLTGFDKGKWIKLCENFDMHDNDPKYRDEQRAFYDTLRDFIPIIKGFKPTLRICMKDFQWCKLDSEKESDLEKFKLLSGLTR